MPIIPYTGPALAPGNPGGYWASEAGATIQPNIKLAPRLAHFEQPPPPEDPYVEIYEVSTPPNSQYNEIVIRLHDDIEEFNLDIQKILDQIPESIKGKNLSVKLSLERPEIPVGPDPEPESRAEPESKPTSTAAAAPPPKTKLTFALPQHLTPHPAVQNWVYLGRQGPPPSTIEALNAELQRAAMQVNVLNEEVDAAWEKAEKERKAAEAAGNPPPLTAQSGPPLSKPQLWLDIEYEGVQTPSFVRAILPHDFWDTRGEIAPKVVVKNENQGASVPVAEKKIRRPAEVQQGVPTLLPAGAERARPGSLRGPRRNRLGSQRILYRQKALKEHLVEFAATGARRGGPLPEDWLEKNVPKGELEGFEEGYGKTVQLYKVIEGDLWMKVTGQ